MPISDKANQPEQNQKFYDYLFSGAVEDRERLTVQYEVFKPRFEQIFAKVLDDYGLAARLEQRRAKGEQAQVLDVGCGEGLFLHKVAAELEKRELLSACRLIGIDRDANAIEAAEQFKEWFVPPRPYLNFYQWDATKPLDDCPGLKGADNQSPVEFDFIFLVVVAEHIPQAKIHLQHFYDKLAPGGVIYLRDYVLEESPRGMISPLPAMARMNHLACSFIASINAGLDVSKEAASWFKEFGAQQVQALPDRVSIDDESDIGRHCMRNLVMGMQNFGPTLVARGRLTQTEYDEIKATIYHDLSPETRGQITWMDTLAQKPE